MAVRRIRNKSIKIGWKNLGSAVLSAPFWRMGAVLLTLEKLFEVKWYITGFSYSRNVVISPTYKRFWKLQNCCYIFKMMVIFINRTGPKFACS